MAALSVNFSTTFKLNPNLEKAVSNITGVKTFTGHQADKIRLAAYKRALAMVRHTHPVTPPPYLSSFYIVETEVDGKLRFRVGNNDPAAVMVEFGAHPGGNPAVEVLGYAPLRTAVDEVANGS